MRFKTPPVVLNLIIVNVIVYLLTNILWPNLLVYFELFYPGNNGLPAPYHFEPYQLVTYMFGHGGFWHIAFNMFALWMFGSQVEMIWGGKKFFLFYMACGLGAAGFNFLVNYLKLQGNEASITQVMVPMLGASGAIFGILAAFGMMFPNQLLLLLFPPIPIKAKYLVIIYGALELFSGLSNNPNDNVAHFAHLGGGLTGLIMLLYWKSRGELLK